VLGCTSRDPGRISLNGRSIHLHEPGHFAGVRREDVAAPTSGPRPLGRSPVPFMTTVLPPSVAGECFLSAGSRGLRTIGHLISDNGR
jgi:hypothetical protein